RRDCVRRLLMWNVMCGTQRGRASPRTWRSSSNTHAHTHTHTHTHTHIKEMYKCAHTDFLSHTPTVMYKYLYFISTSLICFHMIMYVILSCDRLVLVKTLF